MLRVVAEGMVSRRLQGERLVEAISRKVPLIGGCEVKPVRWYVLLWGQVPATVGSRARGWVFVLLAHADVITAIEAALRQGANILFRKVALWVAGPR